MVVDNATFIVDGNRISLMYQINYAKAYLKHSDDEGVTWSEPTELTNAFETIRTRDKYEWKVIAMGPGLGHSDEVKRMGLLMDDALGIGYSPEQWEEYFAKSAVELAKNEEAKERTRVVHRMAELKDNGLQIIREAVALVEGKATPEEVDEYKKFVVTLAHKVAAAHREHGTDVSPAEQAAIDEISATLGT